MNPSGYWWCRPMVCATRSAGSRLISRIDERPSSRKPSAPSTRQRQLGRAHVVEGEARVEQPDERPDRAGGVVVLGLAEQQRRAALDVAQVDVVAERRAPDPAAAVDREHHLGLGVVPARDRVQPDLGAPADRRHRLALGEDLGVRADADLEVLAPEPLGDAAPPWPPPPRRCPGGCRAGSAPISPAMRSRIASARAGSPAARSSMTRSTIERAKVTPQALSACRSQGASSRGPPPRPGGDLVERPDVAPLRSPQPARRVVQFQQVPHRGQSRVVTSSRRSPRRVTTQGPSTPSSQTRPDPATRAFVARQQPFVCHCPRSPPRPGHDSPARAPRNPIAPGPAPSPAGTRPAPVPPRA